MIETFTFDDILIMPKGKSRVASRKLVNIKQTIYDTTFPTPILSASMSVFDTMSRESRDIYYQFANAIFEAGGTHIFSRSTLFDDRFKAVKTLTGLGVRCGIAVSLREFEVYQKQLEELNNQALVSIDIANGAIIGSIDWNGEASLIVGNYGNPWTYEERYTDWYGNLMIKLGIGSGAGCTTRMTAGVGAPQAWLIHKAAKERNKFEEFYQPEEGLPIISDGGVNSTADFVKAIALGADLVMMGSMLAVAAETPWEPVKINGEWYKPYRGMASQEEKRSSSHIEGASGYLPFYGLTVKEIIDEMKDGLTSAMSYSDSFNLDEFRQKAEFLKVTNATRIENNARLVPG